MLSSKSSTVFHGHTRKFNEDSNNTSISWINLAWVACCVWTAYDSMDGIYLYAAQNWRVFLLLPLHASMSVDMATSSTLSACKLALHPFWNHTNLLEEHWLRFPQSHVSFLRLKTKNLCNCFHMVNHDSGFCSGIEKGFRVPNSQLTRAKNQSINCSQPKYGKRMKTVHLYLLDFRRFAGTKLLRVSFNDEDGGSSHCRLSHHWIIISGYLSVFQCKQKEA